MFILLQMFDDGSLANVPGVEYMIDVSEVFHDRRVEYAVGISDHADTEDLECRGISCHCFNPANARTVLRSLPLWQFVVIMASLNP